VWPLLPLVPKVVGLRLAPRPRLRNHARCGNAATWQRACRRNGWHSPLQLLQPERPRVNDLERHPARVTRGDRLRVNVRGRDGDAHALGRLLVVHAGMTALVGMTMMRSNREAFGTSISRDAAM
jgi:hypothetical protein